MLPLRFKKSVFTIALLLFSTLLFAQQLSQTVRGTIRDKQSKETLIGATVLLVDSTQTKGAAADLDGNFRLDNIEVGRRTFKITFLGYRENYITVIVTSGKEVVLNIELEQSVVTANAVTIVAEKQKDRPLNQMSTVSSRAFTIEETSRYAGTVNDPSRMAANYAGVSGANDSRNDIVIRGNSPTGLLWRLNGIEIPNPNHFGSLGSTGGPVSMLNNNLLDNSDFMTAAFPAEYGNALAGVFDLNMRSGNNEKYEFLGQIGFNGFEAGAEGPISKKRGSSFLVNYRYSTLDAFNAVGLDFGTGGAVPHYQDLTFKVDLPTEKAGKFSLFGMGGISYVEVLDKDRDSTKENLYDDEMRTDGRYGNNMGVAGLSHTYFFNTNTYSKLSLSASTSGDNYKMDSIRIEDNFPVPIYRSNSNQQKYSLNWSINKKFSAKNFLKTGLAFNRYQFHYNDSSFDNDIDRFQIVTQYNNGASLYKFYTQWQHKFSDKFTLNSGGYAHYFDLNKTYSIEPRIGLRYEMKSGQAISFATGLHSQLQPIYSYFVTTYLPDGTTAETNHNLEMTKSIHYVLAFDKSLGKDFRIKTEAYYQNLFDVPVETRTSWYSMLNEGADFGIGNVDSLQNKGMGKNYGLELTIEKFYSRGYYFLLTGSLFESKYTGSDGVERNTTFNGNYVFNILGGKEWTIRKKNVFGFNIKTTYAGGKRFIPIDFSSSQLTGETEYFYDHAYENRRKDYFRMDIKISYRINRKHTTHEIAIDVNNAFDTKNIWQQQYSPKTNSIKTEYQLGLLPIPQYRITF